MRAHNTIRGRVIRIGALICAIGSALATPVAAEARISVHASYAPHIDRTIVPIRSASMGSQLATWYGPGFYGNRTACGQTLRPGTWGIAHRSLPCGTLVTLNYRGRKVSVRVIDRGPFSGATVDLTGRTKEFLRFTSGNVRMSQLKKFRILPGRAAR